MMAKHTDGRRLQATMSDECEAKCPGAKAVTEQIIAKTGEIGADTKMSEEMKGLEMMSAYCLAKDVMPCTMAEAACNDDPSKAGNPDEGAQSVYCMCSCPDMLAMAKASVKEREAG